MRHWLHSRRHLLAAMILVTLFIIAAFWWLYDMLQNLQP
jgi:hypothetical protein